MALHDIMGMVVEEKAESKAEKKHYIPFSKDEFEKLRVAFKKPGLMPNDVKVLLLAICDEKLDIVLHPKEVARRAEAAAKKA